LRESEELFRFIPSEFRTQNGMKASPKQPGNRIDCQPIPDFPVTPINKGRATLKLIPDLP
jgi:hypothetical protein